MIAKKAAPQGTQVVLRALRILKSFTPEHPERQLGEIAEALELSKSTAHRLLAALESEGMVTHHPRTRGYRLGPAAVALGTQALRSNDLRTLARPLLVELAEATDETATLEVLVDGEILILDEVAGHHLVAASAETGTRWPLHATSTGKALLAEMDAADRRALLSTPLVRFTPSTVVDPAVLDRELAEAREQGWAVAPEELEVGYVAVGAAFFGPLGEAAGALSLGGPASRLDAAQLEDLGRRLRAAARELSHRLGAVSPS